LLSSGFTAQNSSSVELQDSIFGNRKEAFLTTGVQGSLLANNALNYTYGEANGTGQYTRDPGTSVCFGFSSGLSFLLGRSETIKQIVDLGYCLARAQFDNTLVAGFGGGRDYWETRTVISRTSQFVYIGYGIRASLSDRFHISLIAALNQYYKQSDNISGYNLHKGISSVMTGQTFYDSIVYDHTPVVKYNLQAFPSFKLGLSYDLYVGNRILAPFCGVMMGSKYKSSWWMLGLQYYPFRKKSK
jgi:hypothetical protein